MMQMITPKSFVLLLLSWWLSVPLIGQDIHQEASSLVEVSHAPGEKLAFGTKHHKHDEVFSVRNDLPPLQSIKRTGLNMPVISDARGLDYWDEIELLILSPDQFGTEELRAVLDGYEEINAASFPAADLPDLSLSDLMPYDVVMIFNNNQWEEAAGVTPSHVGDVLAAYLDADGLFIENSYVMDYSGSPWGLQGDYVTGDYSAFTQASDDIVGEFDMGVIHEPEHPVMTDVDHFGMESVTLIQDNQVAEGATRIADWENGEVLLAVKEQVASLNFLPMSGGDINFTGDGATLYKNLAIWLMLNSAPADSPGIPANFTIEPGEMGTLEASLTWTNPDETMDGSALDELDAINIYRDNQLVHTVENPQPGESDGYLDDSITEAGMYDYAIHGENDAGEGLPARADVFVGEDLPGAPLNIQLTAEGNDGAISWDPPVDGLHGGYFDSSDLRYHVVRFPDETTVASHISQTDYTDTDIPVTGNYYYAVTTVNDLGEGGTGESNVVLLGADDLLLFESFDGSVFPPTGWTYVNGVPGAYWEQNSNYSIDGDYSARAYQGYQSDYQADEWLITPLLDFDDPAAQLLTFYGFTTTTDTDGIRETIYVMAVDEAYDNVEDLHDHGILLGQVSTSTTWEEFIIDLTQLSGEMHLAFLYHIGPEDDTSFAWVYIDQVMVGDFNIHMLTVEEPEGEGSVEPAPGDHMYVEGSNVDLLAIPEYGWDFSHWEGDVHEPGQMQTTIQMDEDKTIKAHFVPLEPTPTPHFEDFTGVATGDLPVGWTRTHENWGAWPAANAGGRRPEMRFHWNPGSDDQLFRLTSRPIDASHEDELELSFKHFVNNFLGGYTIKVQSSTDTISWNTEWSMDIHSVDKGRLEVSPERYQKDPDVFLDQREGMLDHGPEEVTIDLDHLAGEEEFFIAFVFEGDNSRINSWFIDDVFIAHVQPTQHVHFMVENSLDGEPVSGAQITFDEYPAEAMTNQQGQASVELPAGAYTAFLSRESFHDAEKSFEVADEDLSLHVFMDPVDGAHNVVFNVDMATATFGEEEISFDPEAGHQVFISGSFEGEWPVPGADPELELTPRPENPDMFTLTLSLPDGEYAYKYFVIPDGQPGWDYAEWEGAPDRTVDVDGPMMINDVWGEGEVSIDDTDVARITAYPNPSKDLFMIRASEPIKKVWLKDLHGRLYHQSADHGYEVTVHTSGIPSGMYLAKVQTKSETQTLTIQIIH